MQERHNSSANALELRLSCTNPSICGVFSVAERLADSIRVTQVPSIQAQVFLCFRVLVLRMTPNHLTSLWPTVITELVRLLSIADFVNVYLRISAWLVSNFHWIW